MTHQAWIADLPVVDAPRPTDPIYPLAEAPSKLDPIPAFGDDVWPVRFFSNNPSMQDVRIDWTSFPESFRTHFRLATWALFNVPVPAELLAESAGPMVSRLSALRIFHSAMDWRMLGRWMQARDIQRVSDLTREHMTAYAHYLRYDRRVARATIVNHLSALTRLWIIGRQLPQLQLRDTPPWLSGRVDDYLPPAGKTRGENTTEPIATATMSALLNAAIRYIDIATEPVLAAAEVDRAVRKSSTSASSEPVRGGAGRLNVYLSDLQAEGKPFPLKRHNGKTALDCSYISHVTGVGITAVYNWACRPGIREYALAHGEETMIMLREDELLPSTIPLTEVPSYQHLLQTACYIVVAYLTGMRPGEVLALEAGSLRPTSANGGWMLIRSRTFKTARDEDGNHDSNGQVRVAPWVAVTPVITAIRTLERMIGGPGLLFPSVQHLRNAGRSQGLSTAADSVVRFVEYVNSRCPGRIPDDAGGRIAPIRFRRTLAWHIANQPGGLVAVAVQYGHLRTAISEGYASRVRDGIHDLIDLETARSIALRLSEVSEAMQAGEGVSGPAARRFVTALREQSEQFRGIVTSPQQARTLLKNPNLTVYQNEEAFLWCNFNRDSAQCMGDDNVQADSTPRLDRCKRGCSNIARTDEQATQLQLAATRLRDEADVMPRPAAERLRARADVFDADAVRHLDERRTLWSTDVDI